MPVIWLVVSVVFLLIHLVPGDPIQPMLGEGAARRRHRGRPSCLRARTSHWSRQYLNYWSGVLHGDLGRSLRLDQSVGQVIARAYPATLTLTVCALWLPWRCRFPPVSARRCAAIAGMIAR